MIVSTAAAQQSEQDSSYIVVPADSLSDTLQTVIHADSVRAVTEGIFEEPKPDSLDQPLRVSIPGEIPDTTDTLHLETLNPTIYYRRDLQILCIWRR